MADVITRAGSGIAINNGTIIINAQKTGTYARRAPDINSYVPSGTMETRLDTRFDEYYGGPPSGY